VGNATNTPARATGRVRRAPVRPAAGTVPSAVVTTPDLPD
jgi:hypothetical protein